MSLCENCQQFNIQAFREPRWIPYLAVSVVEQTRIGCSFCLLLSKFKESRGDGHRRGRPLASLWYYILCCPTTSIGFAEGSSGVRVGHVEIGIGADPREGSWEAHIGDEGTHILRVVADPGKTLLFTRYILL